MKHTGTRKRSRLIGGVIWAGLLVASIGLILGGGLWAYLQPAPNVGQVNARYARIVGQKNAQTLDLAQEIDSILTQEGARAAFAHFFRGKLPKRLEKLQTHFLIGNQTEILFWTLAYNPDTWQVIREGGEYILLNGTWFHVTRQAGIGHEIALLVPIRTQYEIHNRFLRDTYLAPFEFLERAVEMQEGSPRGGIQTTPALPVGLCLLDVLLLTLALLFPRRWRRLVLPLALGGVLVLQRIISASGLLVSSCGLLFSPHLLALSHGPGSIGEFLLQALILLTSLLVLRTFTLDEGRVRMQILRIVLWCGMGVGLLTQLPLLIQQLVYNSTLPLLPYGFANLSPYALLVFVVLALVSASVLLSLSSTLRLLWGIMPRLRPRSHDRALPAPTYLIAILLLAGVCTLSLEVSTRGKMRILHQKRAAQTRSQRDPVAEFTLTGLAPLLEQDSIIPYLLFDRQAPPYEVQEYIEARYPREIPPHYDLQLTVCSPGTQIVVEPAHDTVPCLAFFNGLLAREGERVGHGDVHYLDNHNGRVSYLAPIVYERGTDTMRIYLEFDSRPRQSFWGYPELLLDGPEVVSQAYGAFSTALYHDSTLRMVTGDYVFPTRLRAERSVGAKFFLGLGPRPHREARYTFDGGDTVVLAVPQTSFLERAGGFLYLLLIFLLVIGPTLRYSRVLPVRRILLRGLSGRVQRLALFIFVLNLPLAFLATLMALTLSMRRENQSSMHERAHMVQAALTEHLNQVPSPEPSTDLQTFLPTLSNQLYCDINLYSPQGWLVATSRPEIFARLLVATRIPPAPFHQLRQEQEPTVIRRERIGRMEFTSIYTPLTHEGQEIGILHIPYFAQPNQLRAQVVAVASLILNLFFVLSAISLVRIFSSANRLARPVRALGDSLQALSLQHENKPLTYNRDDEIGQLVQAYNKMLDQLHESSQLLAASERQAAWQGMAMQIAHDIKNPLTPIKLRLQHLVSMKAAGNDEWRTQFDTFAPMLLQQIDTLAQTATSLSQFARIADGRPESILLNPQVTQAAALYQHSPRLQLTLTLELSEGIRVFIDPSHLQRVLNNLIHNAEQAVEGEEEGLIHITTEVEGPWVRIHVHDSGPGIPPGLLDHLFDLHFSTKVQGSGLGLTIARAIIQANGGTIECASPPGRGATFTVTLPIFPPLRHA